MGMSELRLLSRAVLASQCSMEVVGERLFLPVTVVAFTHILLATFVMPIVKYRH